MLGLRGGVGIAASLQKPVEAGGRSGMGELGYIRL